jgi:hypothetical protein
MTSDDFYYPLMKLHSVTHGRLSGSTAVLVDLVVTSSLIALEHLDLWSRHQASDHIGLDLLEFESEALVRVVFFVCLVLNHQMRVKARRGMNVPCGRGPMGNQNLWWLDRGRSRPRH